MSSTEPVFKREAHNRNTIKEIFSRPSHKKNGCRIWLGNKDKNGYGVVRLVNKIKRLHRLSYEVHKGKIPKGFFVLHKCDNPSCFNPTHLWTGTAKQNSLDMVKKNRSMSGEKNYCSILTWKNVEFIRKNYKKFTYSFLAKKFKVGSSTIFDAARQHTWKRL